MKQIFLNIAMILIAVSCVAAQIDGKIGQRSDIIAYSAQPVVIAVDREKQRAVEAIKVFASTLQEELQKGIKEGGTIGAITVCNSNAGLIATDVSNKQNLSIKRVSLKNRNPNNLPNAWQKKVLEDFEKRKLKGESSADLTYADVVETGAGRQFRFMKAIPTRALCIRCHGVNISHEVRDRLDKLYPNDKARGFHPGNIRGAFVVTTEIQP